MNSGEDQLGVFAQLYSLPWLSFRGVVWRRQQRNAPGYSIPELMLPGGGDKHPNPYGHQYAHRRPCHHHHAHEQQNRTQTLQRA